MPRSVLQFSICVYPPINEPATGNQITWFFSGAYTHTFNIPLETEKATLMLALSALSYLRLGFERLQSDLRSYPRTALSKVKTAESQSPAGRNIGQTGRQRAVSPVRVPAGTSTLFQANPPETSIGPCQNRKHQRSRHPRLRQQRSNKTTAFRDRCRPGRSNERADAAGWPRKHTSPWFYVCQLFPIAIVTGAGKVLLVTLPEPDPSDGTNELIAVTS